MISIEQKTFNAAYIGLSGQGWVQSVTNSRACRYRHLVDGKEIKCAAGHMIRDDQYQSRMEGLNATADEVSWAIRENGFDPTFAEKVQQCHDGRRLVDGETFTFTEMNPSELKAAFDVFAEKNGLTIPQVPS